MKLPPCSLLAAAVAIVSITAGCTSNTKRFQMLEGRVESQELVAGDHARTMGVLEARLEQARAREAELSRLQQEAQGRLAEHGEAIERHQLEVDEYRRAVDDYRGAVDGVRDQQARVLRSRLESVKRATEALDEERAQIETMLRELEGAAPPAPPPAEDEEMEDPYRRPGVEPRP